MTALAKQEQHTAWQLRGEWARGARVRVTLTDRCMIRTIVGRVTSVAVTGAFFIIDGWTVPTVEVLGVATPTLDDQDRYEAEAQSIAELQLHPDDWSPTRAEAA